MHTLLCVPITVRSIDSALRDVLLAKERGADIVEFRIDGYVSDSVANDIASLVSRTLLPCILTCRSVAEGGEFNGDEGTRLAIVRRCCTDAGAGEQSPRYVDVEFASLSGTPSIRAELAAARSIASGGSPGIILSLHDFVGRPNDLSRRVRAMQGFECEVLKIAFRARSVRDNLEVFDLLAERDRPTIALAMGEFGLMSRVLAPKFGGFLTFASLHPQSVTAPGQPTIQDLVSLYRFREIHRKTRVYGIIGDPVGHSMSPLVHNAGFGEIKHDGVYLPVPVPVGSSDDGAYENFKATLLEFIGHPLLDFAGCSITIPHKERLVQLAREQGWTIEPTAIAIGAANTLRIARDSSGRVSGIEVFNTDAAAAVSSIADAIGGTARLRGLHVGIVGAGGAGRAVAHGVLQAGSRATIYNRTAQAAEELVDDLMLQRREPARAASLDELRESPCEVFVNCTPVGMKGGPAPDELSIPVEHIEANRSSSEPRPIVLDTVYNPVETPLIVAARNHGWRVIDGVEMFVRQAEAQFQLWTASRPPVGMFDLLVRRALSDERSRA